MTAEVPKEVFAGIFQPFLSEGTLIRVCGARVLVRNSDEEDWAEMAVAYPYRPTEGDRVLVISHGERRYAIGVLFASGRMNFTVPGDLSINAPLGQVEIKAAKGVKLCSPHVRIHAGSLRIVADVLKETFHNVTRHVTDALHIRAGSARLDIDGTFRTGAGRIVSHATDEVKIDGRKIHLG